MTPYPRDTAGSQRFRFEQYLPSLSEQCESYDYQSFIDQNTWSVLYKKGYALKKAKGILLGFLRRFWMLRNLKVYDFVFIHREATPIGPPIIEWLITRVWRKKVIYDFDDAIWLRNTTSENGLIAWLKFPGKVNHIISWSYKISAGNQFLMDQATSYSKSVVYNPTTIDTEHRHLPDSRVGNPIVIGWTGTHSTLKYLEVLRRSLELLSETSDFEFLVIADKPPSQPFPNQRFIAWDKQNEIDDLNRIDIGVMPLVDDEWAWGKCGFKALQFMALEKPVLVSPVGVNTQIVEHGIHGFHCRSEKDWVTHLNDLLKDVELRKSIGEMSRKKVIEQYSVESNRKNFLSLFE